MFLFFLLLFQFKLPLDISFFLLTASALSFRFYLLLLQF